MIVQVASSACLARGKLPWRMPQLAWQTVSGGLLGAPHTPLGLLWGLLRTLCGGPLAGTLAFSFLPFFSFDNQKGTLLYMLRTNTRGFVCSHGFSTRNHSSLCASQQHVLSHRAAGTALATKHAAEEAALKTKHRTKEAATKVDDRWDEATNEASDAVGRQRDRARWGTYVFCVCDGVWHMHTNTYKHSFSCLISRIFFPGWYFLVVFSY